MDSYVILKLLASLLQKYFERDMQKAQKDFGLALQNVLKNADILIKNK